MKPRKRTVTAAPATTQGSGKGIAKKSTQRPEPIGVIRYEDYREMLKGRYIPEGWEK